MELESESELLVEGHPLAHPGSNPTEPQVR